MKRIDVCLLVVMLAAFSMSAQQITPDEAKSAANDFLITKSQTITRSSGANTEKNFLLFRLTPQILSMHLTFPTMRDLSLLRPMRTNR